jgi:hypothetical protein
MEAGLDGIALTEHDLWWPHAEFEKLREKFPGLTIFRGAEYSCAEGHFLLLLPDGENNHLVKPCGIARLSEAVHRRGGLVIWAHPFRFGEDHSSWIDAVELDGIEVMSSNMDKRIALLARKIAQEKGLMMFYNSDTHRADTLGKYYNEIPVRLRRIEDLVGYLQNTP